MTLALLVAPVLAHAQQPLGDAPKPADARPVPGVLVPWQGQGAAEIPRLVQPEVVPGPTSTGTALTVNAATAARTWATTFVDACLAHRGRLQAVVDWALTAGFVPQDLASTSARTLLGDRAGAVLSPPGAEGRVLLAVDDARHCVLWVEQGSGPGLRAAWSAVMAQRASQGDRFELETERRVERGGAWRQQSQWRVRQRGQADELGVGLVTTLTDAPAAQVMRLAPMAPLVTDTPAAVSAR
jgi:hypothetical protein